MFLTKIIVFRWCWYQRNVGWSKENLFGSNNEPEIHIFNYLQHQKLLLVADQLQGSTFLFDSNSEDIGTSKLLSQLKLLASLLELKDNNTIFLRLLLLSQVTNAGTASSLL